MVPQHSQDGTMSRADFDLLTSTTTAHNINVTSGPQSSSIVFGSQLVDKNSITPYSDATQAWQLRFSHLVGYGAKYYSYLISRAIASWIWHTYFAADPFNRSNGERYRRECLAYGGGMPSKQLVANFLQRDVTPSNLSQSLIDEIDINNKKIEAMSDSIENITIFLSQRFRYPRSGCLSSLMPQLNKHECHPSYLENDVNDVMSGEVGISFKG